MNNYEKMIEAAQAHNNTIVWQEGDCVYIETVKPINYFKQDINECGFQIVSRSELNLLELMRLESDKPISRRVVGGKACLANVYCLKLAA